MITEHKELLGQIEQADATAAKLIKKGENLSNISRHLRAAAADTQKRIDYYTGNAQLTPEPVKRKPAAPKNSAEGKKEETKD